MRTTVVYFDLDGTLLRGESQFAFLIWCWRAGIVPRFRSLCVAAQYASYVSGISRDATRLRASGFGLLKGISVERLENAGRDFLTANLVHRLRPQSLPLVEAHRAKGHLTVLLTSACELVARPVAEYLGIEKLIATRLTTRQGKYTGQRELPDPYGAGKRQSVEKFGAEQGISPAQSFAYADHRSDIPLLELVAWPFATNPTPELRRIAGDKRWPIVDLEAATLPEAITSAMIHPC